MEVAPGKFITAKDVILVGDLPKKRTSLIQRREIHGSNWTIWAT
jgi:hypothetical protein